jgi:hypothetical protein
MASDLAAFEAPCFDFLDHVWARHVQKRGGLLNRQLMVLLSQHHTAVLGQHAEHVGKQAQSHWRQLQNRGFGHFTVLIDQGDTRHARVIERRHQATLCDPGQLRVPIGGHGSAGKSGVVVTAPIACGKLAIRRFEDQ